MLTKAFFHFGEESAGDLHQCFSIYRLINVADLQDGFFRAIMLVCLLDMYVGLLDLLDCVWMVSLLCRSCVILTTLGRAPRSDCI